MFRWLLAIVLLCTVVPASFAQGTAAPAATPASASNAAGKAELVEGDVRFLDRNLRSRQPRVGDAISEGESIVTGADGEVHLRMEDGGYIAVRPGTKMRIASFRAEGGSEDRSVIGLLEGSFRSVTGWIAKLGPQRATVRTPTATIGVRGTEHEPLVIPEGSSRGEPGTYDRVHIGETQIQTKTGTVSVRPNQAGFAPVRGALRPRVLDRVPEFFRPTRNENRFTGLHQRVHEQLDQRRDERRKLIEERRGAAKGQKGAKGNNADKGDKAGKGARGEDKRREAQERREQKKAEQHDKKQRQQESGKAEKRERQDKGKAAQHKAEK